MSAGAGGGRALRVLGFGTYDTGVHPRVGVVLEGLRAHGHRVTERVHPLGFSTAQRVAMLRRPWLVPALAARLADRWLRLSADRITLRGPAAPDVVVVGYLGHFDVLLARALAGPARRGGTGPTIVLDHLLFAAGTAADRGTAPGARTRALRVLDRWALRAADVVLLDTDEHRRSARRVLGGRLGRRRLLSVPVGASQAWFDAREERLDDARPGAAPLSVVFYGLFTPLQGTTTIARALVELARRRGEARVLLVGGGQDEAQVREILGAAPARPHDGNGHGADEVVVLPGPGGRPGGVQVTLRPWVPAAELPALVAAHDVCLGIAGTTPKALAVVPNKVYQGAAAGCAVLTSDTAPQRRAFGQAAVLVAPGDPGALADALAALSADRDSLAARRRACASVADARFSPSAVTAGLDAVLRRARRHQGRTRRHQGRT